MFLENVKEKEQEYDLTRHTKTTWEKEEQQLVKGMQLKCNETNGNTRNARTKRKDLIRSKKEYEAV